MFDFFRRKPDEDTLDGITCVVVDGIMHIRDGAEIVSKPVLSGTISRQHVMEFASASPRNLRIAQAISIAEGIATPDDYATPKPQPQFFSLN